MHITLRSILTRRLISAALIFVAIFAAATNPVPAIAAPVLVLIPGIAGASPNDFLIRNRRAMEARGFETSVATTAGEASRQVRSLSKQGKQVVVVGMSAGTRKAAQVIASGAPAIAVIFVSGSMMPGPGREGVSEILGSPGLLPPTLLVHNSYDQCPGTPPDGARSFVSWSGGRASLKMISGSGPQRQPCGPRSPHGYVGHDSEAVSAILSFARRF